MMRLLLSCLLLLLHGGGAVEDRQYNNVDSAETIKLTNDNIRSALRLWMDTDENDRALVEQLYGGPIEQWNVSAITALEEVFSDTHNFDSDLSQWDVSRVTSLRAAFYNTTQFAANIATWDMSKVVDMRVLIAYGADFLSDLSNWNTASLRNLRAAFTDYQSTSGIKMVSWNSDDSLPISSWKTPELTDMEGLFAGTNNFHVDLSGWTTSKVTSMSYMLENSTGFYGGDLSLLDTSSVETMERMFAGAVNVRAARDISQWDTSNVYNMDKIFFNTTVTLNDGDSAPDDVDLFYLCWDLTGLEEATLDQAFCNSNAGGFNCDCLPDNLADTINVGCDTTQRICYNSLGETEEAEQETDPTEPPTMDDLLTSSASRGIEFISGWRTAMLLGSAVLLFCVTEI